MLVFISWRDGIGVRKGGRWGAGPGHLLVDVA